MDKPTGLANQKLRYFELSIFPNNKTKMFIAVVYKNGKCFFYNRNWRANSFKQENWFIFTITSGNDNFDS